MNFQKRSSAGQKRRTPFFPSLHTSYFIKQEAKYLVSKNENRLYSGFCTLLIFGVLSLVFFICAASFYFLEKYGLPTLTHSSQKLLFYTFSFCVLFFGFFICFALFCGLLRFAYNDEKERGEKNVLFAFYSKKAFGKVFLEPGETKTVEMFVNNRGLAFYDVESKAFVVEAGEFEVHIGNASDNIWETAKILLTK